MSESIQLPNELLSEIQDVKNELTENVIAIGRLNVQKRFYEKDLEMINAELESLYSKAETISKMEEDLQVKVVNQYGEGKLDFATGVYTKG